MKTDMPRYKGVRPIWNEEIQCPICKNWVRRYATQYRKVGQRSKTRVAHVCMTCAEDIPVKPATTYKGRKIDINPYVRKVI